MTSGWPLGVVAVGSGLPPVVGIYTFLGMPPGAYDSDITAISADGSTVVGTMWLDDTYNTGKGWKWTEADGFTLIEPPLGFDLISPSHVSEDGSVITGDMKLNAVFSSIRAFYYTDDDGVVSMGVLGQVSSQAGFQLYTPNMGISRDGTKAIFNVLNIGGAIQKGGYYEIGVGASSLGDPSVAWILSADGSTVGGEDSVGSIRWTAGGSEQIPYYSTDDQSFPNGCISADGSLVGGYSYLAAGVVHHLWRYSAATLTGYAGSESRRPTWISADKAIILGTRTNGEDVGFRLDVGGGTFYEFGFRARGVADDGHRITFDGSEAPFNGIADWYAGTYNIEWFPEDSNDYLVGGISADSLRASGLRYDPDLGTNSPWIVDFSR